MKSEPPFKYLMSCTKEGIENVRLNQLARDANLRKQIKEMAEERIEALALVMLCEWVERLRMKD